MFATLEMHRMLQTQKQLVRFEGEHCSIAVISTV